MGGPSTSTQSGITTSALDASKSYQGMAQPALQEFTTLTDPLKQQNQSIIDAAKSGNYQSLISAGGPQISTLTNLFNQSQEQIYNQVPAGAGRDAALAQAKMGEGSNIASTLNQLFQGALTSQAGLGGQFAQVGLQEAGAGLNALNLGSQSNQAVMSAQEQAKASTMGFLGSLAGAAGGAIGGFGPKAITNNF